MLSSLTSSNNTQTVPEQIQQLFVKSYYYPHRNMSKLMLSHFRKKMAPLCC